MEKTVKRPEVKSSGNIKSGKSTRLASTTLTEDPADVVKKSQSEVLLGADASVGRVGNPAGLPTLKIPTMASGRILVLEQAPFPLNNRGDFHRFVTNHYITAGWSVIPTTSINDMIAHKTLVTGKQNMHFIQIGINGDSRFTGEIRNAFVQNAFSNGAHPIHAIIDVGRKSLRLRNANTMRTIRL